MVLVCNLIIKLVEIDVLLILLSFTKIRIHLLDHNNVRMLVHPGLEPPNFNYPRFTEKKVIKEKLKKYHQSNLKYFFFCDINNKRVIP